MSEIGSDIVASVVSNEVSVSYLKYSFAGGCGVFIFLMPFVRGHKSSWDLLSAKKISKYLRFFIFIEITCLVMLLYYAIGFGNPLKLNYSWVISPGVSWLYSYPRPISGIILIGFGFSSDLHIAIRLCCLFGTVLEIISDCISCVQVELFYEQVSAGKASGGKYSAQDLFNYYIRDVVSVGLCTIIFLLNMYLLILLGIQWNQAISYSIISGGDLDRCEVMRQQRNIRKSIANLSPNEV